MTSFAALLFLYPVFFLLLGIALGIFFKTSKLNVILIIFIGFLLSNLAFYYLAEGGFAGIERDATGKGLAVFSGLSISEILSVLITPSLYTIMYVVLLLLSFLITNLFKKGRNKSISM
ncbi:hypothetical protein AAEO50_19385 [Rossellomorea oryzaecorticis]|uniref:NADH dehydrogenase subunit 6 n=1 Tax=Rossellomorea oryzaecorticis TaxID=1396505 RepID=A0ABU9KEJ1_9BACI